MTADHSASNYPVGYWPLPVEPCEFENTSYNVIVYQFDDCFAAFTADAFGMNGEGDSVAEALQSLKETIEWRAIDGCGGVFSATSPIGFQEKSHEILEKQFKEDGVTVCGKTSHVITVFPTDTK
jgi:hypothetical protein